MKIIPTEMKNFYLGTLPLNPPYIPVRKNSESDPSEAKRNRLVANRNDIYGNITSYLVY